ncbi:SEC-C metal-binding domain-containing protein [Sphingomonas sp.]|uniref:SEC-C metal-binding domain-containing protein n=1 Tax=Sphingomonas sp. TaxID=28214 RepID=UPI001EBE627C|nr:SEC-C domain-containing protein [Sphingomonas sp.]
MRGGEVELLERLGRNDPCPCGSGRRFKACCLRSGRFRRNDAARLLAVRGPWGSMRGLAPGPTWSCPVRCEWRGPMLPPTAVAVAPVAPGTSPG